MKLLNRLSILILLVVAISSCNVNNGFIQKRKYQKGYHLSMKKKISNSDNSKLKDNQLEQNNELAKESSFSKASEKNNGAVIKTENTNTEDVAEKAIENNGNKEKVNHIKTNAKNLAEQIKSVIENQSIAKNNTASKSKSNDDSDLITLILIILLVILALALFALIDGLLGGFLSLILLIIIIVLLLQFFGVI